MSPRQTWKLRIVGELELDSYSPNDEQDKQWLIQDILLGFVDGGQLVLHSNEIGDEVGIVRISEVTEWVS